MSMRVRLGRWITRLSSATILALLLVGVPYGLVTQIGSPFPTNLPTTVEDVERALTTPITDEVVIHLLAVAMWIIWFTFTTSVIAEIPARVRGVNPRHFPVVAPVQTIAGWLLSGITAGVIAAAAITPVPIATDAHHGPAVHATLDISAQPGQPAVTPVALTAGLGGRLQNQSDHQPPVVCAGEHILVIDGKRYAYQVQRDDSLWTIAELCLDDGRKWPEIWKINQGRHFPSVGGSLHDPDLIYPGWDLYLPPGAAPPPGAQQVRPSQPAQPTPPQPSTPAGTATPASPAPAPTPTGSPPATAAPTPATSPNPPPREEQYSGDQEPDSRSLIDAALPVTAVLATAGLFAALLLARLHRRRGRQLQHRRHGRRLPEPDPAAETTARVAAQPADVARLDDGLRVLGAGLHGRGPGQLPDVVAVWLEAGTVHLLLAGPCPDPPAPYRATTNAATWTLPAEAALPDAHDRLCPLPALVTIASHPAGQHLLVDLERPGLLTITGDPDRTRDLLRYLAAELATASWIDDAEIVLVGFDPEETEQLITLGEDRLHAAVSLPDALARIARRASANAAAIADSGAGTSLAGRVNDIIADAWMPHLLLVADPTAELADVEAQLRDAGRCAVAVIAAASTPSTWSVHVDQAGGLSVDWLTISDAHAARLPADQLARLAAVMQAARTTLADEHPPDPHHGQLDEPVPPASSDEPWAEGTDQHGHLLEPEPVAPPPAAATPADGTPAGAPAAADGPARTAAFPASSREAQDPEGSPAVDPVARQPDDPPAPAPAAAPPDQTAGIQPTVALPAPAGTRRPAPASTTGRKRRMAADPDLDADLRAWHAPDPHRPRIAILGPVTIHAAGKPPADRPRFHAEIIVYLATRGSRGASADQLDAALWPERRISQSARRVNMTKVRRWLGEDANGQQWLPPNMGEQRLYRLADGHLLDWHLFRRLRTRGEARGAAGATDLRRALELVHGAPLDGCDRPYQAGGRNPYTWLPASGIQPHHLAAAIVDTAHQLVGLYLEAADTPAARWAVDQAWQADPERLDDHPWLDLMRITAAEGHTSELRSLIEQLIETREVEVPEDLSPDTYRQINHLAGDLLRVA
jgi:hypothetical protein